ncbi:MAG: hypothetical protein Q9175_002354 [Cornicularia normoerica]
MPDRDDGYIQSRQNSHEGYVQTWYQRPFPRQQYPGSKNAPVDISVVRKHVSHGPGFSRERRIVELDHSQTRGRDLSPKQPRHPSRSANSSRRELVLANKGRRRHDSSRSDSDSDSDSETDGLSPRRIRNRKHYNKDLPVARNGPTYANPPHRSRSMGAPRPRPQGPPSPPRRYDGDSDVSSDDNRGKKTPSKPLPKQILYTGLACVATVAAANNIYQSAKAHRTRQKELEDGEISSAEAQKLKTQARKMDLISLGVAAVGAYNVRNGWRRAEGHTFLRSKKCVSTPHTYLQTRESVSKGNAYSNLV